MTNNISDEASISPKQQLRTTIAKIVWWHRALPQEMTPDHVVEEKAFFLFHNDPFFNRLVKELEFAFQSFADKQNEHLANQIDTLAGFILKNVPGEPSQSEGAVECAIRIIHQLQQKIAELEKQLKVSKANAESWESACKLDSKLPCGHPNDCSYDKNNDGRWANIGCVWCERDQLQQKIAELESSNATLEKAKQMVLQVQDKVEKERDQAQADNALLLSALQKCSDEAHKHVDENGFGAGREIIGITDEALALKNK